MGVSARLGGVAPLRHRLPNYIPVAKSLTRSYTIVSRTARWWLLRTALSR
jgi:hypothetical protein